MTERGESTILGRLMLAFEGNRIPARIGDRLAAAPAAGVTLFRHHNVRSPGQVRELADALQAAATRGLPGDRAAGGAAGHPLPLLIAADQEGGQFLALGDGSTPFAGNMALGAADDVALTEAVGRAIGTESRAMGVNVVYAPVIDLATNPSNPALGIRAFGDDPERVAAHGVAMVRGLQSAGVAATVKHAPGKGHVALDTHHGIAAVHEPIEVLRAREFVPFRAAFAAGARLAMSGHLALPAVSSQDDLPSTLSRAVMTDLLRGELGFDGVTISDALDMRALAQGPAQALDVVAAVRAGVDLLLASADAEALDRIERTLVHAAARGLFDGAEVMATARRIAGLRAWVGSAGAAPDLDVVGGSAHAALARDLAERSITLVRDPGGRLPLLPTSGMRIIAVMPRPTDLTPADTSSTVAPGLAAALRGRYAMVQEVVVEPSPTDAEIVAVRSLAAADGVGAVVVGTIDGHRQPSQIRLVEAVAAAAASAGAASGVPVIAVALRGPWDVAAYPAGVTALATYGILPPSLEALAAVVAGVNVARGRAPVAL